MKKTFDKETFVIAHNEADVVHAAKAEPGTKFETGQPVVEEFEDKEAWKERLVELKVDPAKFDPEPPVLPEVAPPLPPPFTLPEPQLTKAQQKVAEIRARRLAKENQ